MKNSTPKFSFYRLFTALLGVLFAGVAVAIVFISDRSLGPMLVALVMGALGVDAVISALRDKPSLLSRIGPLP